MAFGCREVKEVIDTIDALDKLVKSTIEDTYNTLTQEVEQSWDAIKESFAQLPDLWDTLTGPPTADLAETLADNEVFSLVDQVSAQALLEAQKPTLFGASPLVGQVDQNTQQALENKVQQTFDSAFGGCESNSSVAGALEAVSNSAIGTVTSLGTAIQSTVFALTEVDSNFSAAIFAEAAGNFIKRQTSEKFILQQIKDTISEINDDLDKLTEDDYSIDHKLTINESVIRLKRADELLRTQIDNINLKFPANRAGIEAAREEIDAVREIMSGIDLGDLFNGLLSLRAIKIAGRLAYLETLQGMLNAQELTSERIRVNLSGFDRVYADLTNFDELLLPSLSNARCRLGTIIGQMGLSVDQNKLQGYALAEKKWAVDLAVLSTILRATQKLGKVTSNDPLNVEGVAEDLSEMLGAVQGTAGIIEPGQVSDAIDQYTVNVRYKLSYNVNPETIKSRGELVKRLVEQKMEQNESFILTLGSPLDRVNNSNALAVGVAALVAVKSALAAAANFASGAQSLAEGALGDILSGEFLKDMLTGLLAQAITAIKQALAAAGCDLDDLIRGGMRAYDVFEDSIRSDALFNDALSGFPETRIRAILTDDMAKFDFQPVVDPLSRADAPALTSVGGPAPAPLE